MQMADECKIGRCFPPDRVQRPVRGADRAGHGSHSRRGRRARADRLLLVVDALHPLPHDRPGDGGRAGLRVRGSAADARADRRPDDGSFRAARRAPHSPVGARRASAGRRRLAAQVPVRAGVARVGAAADGGARRQVAVPRRGDRRRASRTERGEAALTVRCEVVDEIEHRPGGKFRAYVPLENQ